MQISMLVTIHTDKIKGKTIQSTHTAIVGYSQAEYFQKLSTSLGGEEGERTSRGKALSQNQFNIKRNTTKKRQKFRNIYLSLSLSIYI